jgi:integrase
MHFQPENDANSWLLSYDRYLRDVVGAAATTRIRYWRVVRRFVAACFDNTAGWAPPSVQQVTDFVCEEAASKKGCGRRVSVTAVRSFVRFLAWRGIVPSGLDRARTRLAVHASLPRRLTIDEISRLLDAAMTGKAPCRDRAILLLAVQLGLRSSEIIAMELDDIDWRAGVVRVRIRKSRRERTLPLPRDVGTALADYIQLERPSGLGRGLFIGVNNPPSRLRISEIIGLRRRQLSLDAGHANIQLLGKGRKERVIPLWDETARVLRGWLREIDDTPDAVVFPSARNQPLSRDGADYVLRRAVVTATVSCSSLANKSVSPAPRCICSCQRQPEIG